EVPVDDVVHVGDAGRDLQQLGRHGDPEPVVHEPAIVLAPGGGIDDRVVQFRQWLHHEVGAVARRVPPAGAGGDRPGVGRRRLFVTPAFGTVRVVPGQFAVAAGEELEELDGLLRV